MDHQLLGEGGPSWHAELAAALPFVHHGTAGEGADFAVLGEDDVESAGVLHRPAHQQRVLYAGPVVGEQADAGIGELTERGELLTTATDRDAPAGIDVAEPGSDPCVTNELDDAASVGRRLGVGHRHHGRVAAEGGRAAARPDRLGILATRFPQMGVEVDEAGGDDAVRGIEHCGRVIASHVVSNHRDVVAVDQHVGAPFGRPRRRPSHR